MEGVDQHIDGLIYAKALQVLNALIFQLTLDLFIIYEASFNMLREDYQIKAIIDALAFFFLQKVISYSNQACQIRFPKLVDAPLFLQMLFGERCPQVVPIDFVVFAVDVWIECVLEYFLIDDVQLEGLSCQICFLGHGDVNILKNGKEIMSDGSAIGLTHCYFLYFIDKCYKLLLYN